MSNKSISNNSIINNNNNNSSRQVSIGVLALQGDIEENVSATNQALKALNIDGNVMQVKYPEQVSKIDGIIIPGGESTVIGTLAALNGSLKVLRDRISEGMPALGICAGMIVLAKRAYDRVVGETRQKLLNILDITVERNAFGRQMDSFEAYLNIPLLGEKQFKGVFIRAPVIKDHASNVEVLARLNDKVVAVKQGNIIGTSFHPELADDVRLHMHFLKMVIKYVKH
jgi:5'-phosphate synthase pdxT subunit